jgi:hypothetical protein
MSLTPGNLIRLSAAAGLLSLAAAQTNTKLQFTARELFYAAAEAPKVAAAKPAPPTAAKKKSAPAVPAQPPAQELAKVDERPPRPVNNSMPRPAGDAKIIPAMAQMAPVPASGPALGLRYTILKMVGGEMQEVPPSTVFHAGDRIQFSVQTNSPGYLYIISQGSSGTWKPIFPSPEIADGNNRVQEWLAHTMPPKRLIFDEQTGTEKLFIVLSREPEPDLEKMIYSLQGNKTVPAAEPAAEPSAKPKQMVTFASLNIPDTMVGRLRTTYARDLIVEKVTPQTPGERKETAVYVVNPTGSSDSRVVADLSLIHQ